MGRHEEYIRAKRFTSRALVLQGARAQREHCRKAAFVHDKKRREQRNKLRRLAALSHFLIRGKLAKFCLSVTLKLSVWRFTKLRILSFDLRKNLLQARRGAAEECEPFQTKTSVRVPEREARVLMKT